MGLSIPVIVNSVNNLSDARYAAGMGVEFMGFEVDEDSDRYVTPNLFKAITSWVSGIQTVASISVLNPHTLFIIQENYQPDYILFESIDGITQSQLSEIKCIQKISLSPLTILHQLTSLAYKIYDESSYILLDVAEWIDWKDHSELILTINEQYPILWELPIEQEDVAYIQTLKLKGIAIKGGDEQRPGWKDMDSLIDILEALEEN
jgi:phosphoribosylanthranilate isomerase